MFPAATLTSVTATGDVVTGPGAINIIYECMPAACMGDTVSGAVCVGAITVTECLNVLLDCRPAACMASDVVGVNPITGVPVDTVIAATMAINILD